MRLVAPDHIPEFTFKDAEFENILQESVLYASIFVSFMGILRNSDSIMGTLVDKPIREDRGIHSPDDELNAQIIAMLENDGRTAFSEIAHKLGVSEGTIRNRVNALRDSNMLRIVAITDPVVREYRTDAILGVKVAPGVLPADVATRLDSDPRVVFTLWVGGRFDLILEIVSDDANALQHFLEDEIHSAQDVADVEVMLGIKNFKNQFLLKRDWRRENGSSD